MKDSQFADVYSASLQKELDNDMMDLATEMSTGTGYRSGKKITPAYEDTDVFRRKAVEIESKRAMDNRPVKAGLGVIQPNDPSKPRIMVVMPNE